jgi:cystathionine beta-lyase family protein involved in aluminum resistance
MLYSLLGSGDELIYASGTPYDTIHFTIGLSGEGQGSLKEIGVGYKEIPMAGGKLNVPKIMDSITEKTRVVMLQRAVGYQEREALTLSEIAKFAERLKATRPDIVLACDNCYGEFLEEMEPAEVGVDIMAGSLIKNPGGGIALGGGYIAGRSALIERAGYALTAPGIGSEQGITFGQVRNMLQGLYFAPSITAAAVKGAILVGEVFAKLGYKASPSIREPRSDIIETIYLGSKEKVVAFCEGVQKAAVVDSMFAPVPENDPGYVDKIIMASGSFTQGSSIELSADAPLREPYAVYFQGGLTYAHSRLGVMLAAEGVENA